MFAIITPRHTRVAVSLALAALCLAAPPAVAATACATADYCPIRITNNSTIFSADQFQILAAAQDDTYVNPSTGKTCQGETAASLICPASYVKFDRNGVGKLEAVTVGGTSLPYAKRLSDFPADPTLANTYVLQMPRHGSGRIYVTLGGSITTSVTGATKPLAISDPNISSPQDPNFYKIYDKFETSFLHKSNEPLYINTTSVDFVSIPLSLSLEIPDVTSKVVGYQKSRKTLFETLTAKLNDGVTQDWQKLVQTANGIPLRVVAPNKALQAPYAFDPDYFKDYIQAVWDNFKKPANSITVTATEVLSEKDRNAGKTLTYTAGVADTCAVESAPTPTCGPYATTTSVANALCFKRNGATSYDTTQPDTIPVSLPTGFDVIGAENALCAPNKTARAIIARDVSALLNRGILPNSGAITLNDADKSADGFWGKRADLYYTNKASNGKPNFNLFAKVLHTLSSGGVYAFAFDDVGGADSTLVDTRATAAIVTINDLSGTAIPNPEADDATLYNVTFAFPVGKLSMDGKALNSGDYLTGLKAPFNLVWSGHRLAIYPKTGVISPAALGARSYNIAITPNGGDATNLTVAFPGILPDPWPHSVPQLTLVAKTGNPPGSADLTLGIAPNDYLNVNSEWFLVANNAKGNWGDWFWYNNNTWTRASGYSELRPAYVGPLTNISGATFSIPGVPTGTTTFYVGVDTSVTGGTLDFGTLTLGSVEVTLR